MKQHKRDTKPKPDREFLGGVMTLAYRLTDEARFSWMLDFAQRTDVRGLKDDDLFRVQCEIVAFAMSPDAIATDVHSEKQTARQLNALAEAIRDGVQGFLDGRGWPAPMQGRRTIYRARDEVVVEVDRNDVREKLETDTPTLIIWRAQNLLHENPDRVGHCARAECGRWFAIVKRQMFCSDRCSSLVRTHKWRSKPKNRAKLRRRRKQAYRREMARKQGRAPGSVKIQKRNAR